MKKIFLFFILFINILTIKANTFTTAIDTVYSDIKDGISVVYQDAKVSTAVLYPDIKQTISTIGQAIGVATEYVYTALVKKYVVIAAKELLIFIFSIILIVFGYISYNKKTKNTHITYRVIPAAVCLFLGFILCSSVNYDAMLMGFINPEYEAINYILNYSKDLIK